MTKTAQLEALLFVEGGEMKKKEVAKLLDIQEGELDSIVGTLTQVLSGHGITLVQTDTTLALRTSPEVANFVKEVHENSLQGDLGKAGLETLSILFYKGPSTRTEIDFIRGVNSTSSIRGLLLRGLIERKKEGSVYVYKPSIDALSFLGVTNKEELPEFNKIRSELVTLLEDKKSDEIVDEDNKDD